MFGSVWSVNMANAISRAIHLEGTVISHLLNVKKYVSPCSNPNENKHQLFVPFCSLWFLMLTIVLYC